LFNGAEISEEELEVIKASPIKILLTFNNQEWILSKEFKYYDHKVERIAFATGFGATEIPDQAERDRLWKAEEPIEKYPDDLPADEVKKRDEEKLKRAQEETEESQTVAKRRGIKIVIYGTDFCKMDVRLYCLYLKSLFRPSKSSSLMLALESQRRSSEVPQVESCSKIAKSLPARFLILAEKCPLEITL
jgi:hypothetical protein